MKKIVYCSDPAVKLWQRSTDIYNFLREYYDDPDASNAELIARWRSEGNLAFASLNDEFTYMLDKYADPDGVHAAYAISDESGEQIYPSCWFGNHITQQRLFDDWYSHLD